MNRKRLLIRAMNSRRPMPFRDFMTLVEGFGFRLERITGSHHIMKHPRVRTRLNIQPRRGEAKLYQIRQFLKLAEEYNLKLEDDEE